MSIIQAVKCRFGYHQWSEGHYLSQPVSLKPYCEMERVCSACGLRETLQGEPHTWQSWAHLADDSCTQERSCSRCRAKESRESHYNWGEWAYIEGTCHQERTCKRCRAKERRGNQHDWGEWGRLAPDSHQEVRVCGRCWIEEVRGEIPTADRIGERRARTRPMTSNCAHCGSTFYRPRSMRDKVDFDAMQRVRVGCSQCGTAVCFSCAATAADQRGKPMNCFCPKCGAELGKGGEAGQLGNHYSGWT